jgi:hypothetical protein
MLKQSEMITTEKAKEETRPDEDLVFANCPCCNCLLAVYVKKDVEDTEVKEAKVQM